MIGLQNADLDAELRQVLEQLDLDTLLATSELATLSEVVHEGLSSLKIRPTDAFAAQVTAAIVHLAEAEVANGGKAPFSRDARVLRAIDSGHQLLAWRATRDEWLATRNSSLDGMYLRQRLAKEFPGYELCNGAFCKRTKREIPPDLAAEAARVGGEVRWYTPEQRLVPALKFPLNFQGTEHARWCIRRERSHISATHRLSKRGLDQAKWDGFVQVFMEKLANVFETSSASIQAHGAVFDLKIEVVEDPGD